MIGRNQRLGLLLIAVGGLLLFLKLNDTFFFFNFELPFTFEELFRNMINLWPVTLIFIGLNILFNRHTMFKVVLWVTFIVALVLYSSYGSRFERIYHFIDSFDYHSNDIKTVKEEKEKILDMGSASKGKLKVDLNACSLKMRDIESNSIRINNNINGVMVMDEYNRSEDIMTIKVEENNFEASDTKDSLRDVVTSFFSDDPNIKDRYTDIYLSNGMPWDIITEVNAVNANLNFERIGLETLDIDINAGNMKLHLGDQSIQSDIYINGGAFNLKIYVPETCGVRIIKKGNLMNFSDHFGLEEDLTSENYDEAESTFDIYLNANASNVALYMD